MATTTCQRCRGETHRVLLVDDHPLMRDLLGTLVSLDDQRLDVHSICAVATGEEAVTKARWYRPHLVLMDIGLPGINGLEAARRIKEEAPATEIVMVTALPEPEYREAAASLGAAGFVTKDRVGTELIPLLSQVLDSPKAGLKDVS